MKQGLSSQPGDDLRRKIRETQTPDTDSSITWVITHHVRPGSEQQFEEWLRGINEESARFRGHQGVTILRPGDHPHLEYVVVVRFATYEDLRRWEQSTQRAEWLRRSQPLTVDRPAYRKQSGLETWFQLPGHSVVVPPPKYKMAVLVLLAIYPLILVVLTLLHLIIDNEPFLAAPVQFNLEFVVSTLVSALILTVLMTWVAMPLLTGLASRWLYPTR